MSSAKPRPPSLHSLEALAKYVESQIGIVYIPSNYYQLENRVREICEKLNFASCEALSEYLKKPIDSAANQILIDVCTNNETSFFRDPTVFDYLSGTIFPEFDARIPKTEPVRIWSAAASSGQEPYSLAILARERGWDKSRCQILATDISSRILKRAQGGEYSSFEANRGLSPGRIIEHFTRQDQTGLFLVKEATRAMVNFDTFNLVRDEPRFGRFDLILCRNVLIYFNEDEKKKVIDKLADSLKPGGTLLFGNGEAVAQFTHKLTRYCQDGAVFYRLAAAAA